MNAYYQVDSSPSKARVVTKMAEISSRIVVDPSIAELAKMELVEVHEAYSHDADVVQDIVDYGFRCVIPGNYDDTVELVIEAAEKSGKRLVILCKQSSILYWKKFFKTYKENTGIEPNAEAITVCDDDLLNSDYINYLVDSVVVIEDDLITNGGGAQGNMSNLVFSISNIVVLQSRFNIEKLAKVAKALFVNGPSDILTSPLLRRTLETRGFKSSNVRDLLCMINTINKFVE